MQVKVDVGPGELFDKLTILDIKRQRLTDPGKRANVEREHAVLSAARDQQIGDWSALAATVDELRAANLAIWELEDAARAAEAADVFGQAYVDDTRAIHRFNDLRAALKKRINLALDSLIVEEKSYDDPPTQGAA